MTDIEVHEDKAVEVAAVDDRSIEQAMPMTALMVWALEARQAKAVALSLSKTSFVPASLQGKPDDITAAILAGHELGLQPMAALRSMDIIFGTPALRAHAMRGLVQSHGHEVELVESSAEHCVMRGRRKGAGRWQEVRWDLSRAQAMGLAGKDQWKKQPQTMLIARATGEVCRLIASDVLHAMPYAVEEIERDDTKPGTEVPRMPGSTVADLIGVPPAVTAEPDEDWPPAAQPADAPTAEGGEA